MLLTISTTHRPATDLGYLLHKNPSRVQEFAQTFGKAHVFYPEASEDRCTAAVLLEVDPVSLVRGRKGPDGEGYALAQYVNDRPYVASSFMSVAISRLFGTAMGGRSKEKPELAEIAIPLEAKVTVLPCRGGEQYLRRLFEPLGYEVVAERQTLDPEFPDWGDSSYYTVTLKGTKRVAELLSHLYVMIPVLDNNKHYWVSKDEVEKLLQKGEGWLADHPEKENIARRYLAHQISLTNQALARLIEDDPDPAATEEAQEQEEEAVEKKINLNEQRLKTVAETLKDNGAKTVLDLGCGEGRLVKYLMRNKYFDRVVGVDVSHRCLEIAAKRLKLNELPERQRKRVDLFQGSLMYRDKRFNEYDAITVIEVIEHMDLDRLAHFERVVFEFAHPEMVVVTTPNQEYNVKFENLPAGKVRHRDHRFEWTRKEFENWAKGIAEAHEYMVSFAPIGEVNAELGAPTQMAVFTR